MLITLKSLNQKAKILLISGVAVVIIAILFMIFSKPAKPAHKHPEKAEVFDGGLRIVFKPGSPGLEIVKSTVIGGGGEFVSLEAPARLIASTSPSVSNGSRIILFESAELNDLYVGYIHAKNSYNFV